MSSALVQWTQSQLIIVYQILKYKTTPKFWINDRFYPNFPKISNLPLNTDHTYDSLKAYF